MFGTLVAPIACLVLGIGSSISTQSPLGRKVEDFTLKDYRGKSYSLSDFADSKLVVIAFLGTECPLAKLYGPRLVKLKDRFGSGGVAFLGIDANMQDSITEIAAYARIHKIEFPVLKDLGNRIADRMGAERTPEVFVLDESRIVRYWGRIDDQYGIGYVRNAPKREDLALALSQLLAGNPIQTSITESIGCHIGRVKKPEKDAKVTYSNQIARLLQKRCVECHREGEIAPFSLTEYEEVVGWATMIEEVVREQRMPPWHADPKHGRFKNDRLLTLDEKRYIYDWVAAGAPEGDPAHLPEPRRFTTGWQLPREPDLVVNITEKPYQVPAEGEVRYQYFRMDPGFEEDKWLIAAEIQPGNRAVVHHILCFARPGGSPGRSGQGGVGGFLVGYVPGMRVELLPAGMAKRIPAGSQLIFQVHYTPIGTEQLDQSRLGLVFADPKTITHEVKTTSAANKRIRIPAYANNHREEAWNRRELGSSLLLSLMPHMHLRGKSFLYEAIDPNGRKETLLNVPGYDFNWQTGYRLAEPKPLAAGTRIHCVAHYDNSEQNLNNPDPSKTIRWGDQTWDEMLIGYFDIAVPIDAD